MTQVVVRNLIAHIAVLLGAVLMSDFSRAVEVGERGKGLALARGLCAECHTVEPGRTVSRVREATSFQVIADIDGMTATASAVFFKTSHKTMPNLIISGRDAENLTAHILSLRTRR
ncbi:MAG TPA: cytochrome C [Hyphomicrobiaceae bacterium]|nr:cytochrome C [Hyphomicrobiaceae bacterium]